MISPWPVDPATERLPAADEVARALAEVLTRAEFAQREPGLVERAWRALVEAVGELLGRLFGGLDLAPGAGRGLALGVGLLLAAVAVFILVRLGRGAARRATQRLREWARRASDRRPDPATPGRPTAGDWAERARAAAADGRWRQAALALYRALILRLDARGTVRYHRAKTPGDYRREAEPDPVAGRIVATFVRAFEPIAYGRAEVDDADYARLRSSAGELGVHG